MPVFDKCQVSTSRAGAPYNGLGLTRHIMTWQGDKTSVRRVPATDVTVAV